MSCTLLLRLPPRALLRHRRVAFAAAAVGLLRAKSAKFQTDDGDGAQKFADLENSVGSSSRETSLGLGRSFFTGKKCTTSKLLLLIA